VYAKALVDAVETWRTDEPVQTEQVEEVLSKLNDALSVERTRQWGMILDVSGNPETAHLQNLEPAIPKSFTAAAMAHAQVYPQSGPPPRQRPRSSYRPPKSSNTDTHKLDSEPALNNRGLQATVDDTFVVWAGTAA
jgi:hypothetical protein